jgi:hypothetical protein
MPSLYRDGILWFRIGGSEETLDTSKIIQQIDSQILKLQAAKALLTSAVTKSGPGRPKKSASVVAPEKKSAKRVPSAEAKEKMAAAQKKRWAKVRRAAKKAAKTEAAG